jgi:hypothetical protein
MNKIFISWASKYCDDAKYMNPSSSLQVQQLLFGQYKNEQLVEASKTFTIEKEESEFAVDREQLLAANPYAEYTVVKLKEIAKSKNLATSGKKVDFVARLLQHDKYSNDQYSNMDENMLKALCLSRGLSSKGNVDEMRDRLRGDFGKFSVSPPAKCSKKRDITLTTIGMIPKDFTPTGEFLSYNSSVIIRCGTSVRCCFEENCRIKFIWGW